MEEHRASAAVAYRAVLLAAGLLVFGLLFQKLLTLLLAVLALEKHGLKPDKGPAVVTGAAGGVGSVATALLAKTGWHVIASTGRGR